MKRLLAFFALLLSPLLSFADSSSFINTNAIANHTDLSVAYLSQLFGSVSGVLHGTSGQMMGHLLFKFNEGVLVLAGLWLGYSVFVMVLRAAGEGSFLGQNKNVHLLFLRIALGFGLLIPNPTTGYNLLQDAVMKITVAGAGLADQVWNYSLQYLDNGGAIWHNPAKTADATGAKLTTGYLNGMLGVGVIQKGMLSNIFASEVCMLSSTENSAGSSSAANGNYVSGQPRTQYHVTDFPKTVSGSNLKAGQYLFPGLGGSTSGPNNACGSVSYNISNACDTSGSSKCMVAKQAVYQAINTVKPAAQKYYCSIHSGASVCGGIYTNNTGADNEQSFMGATLSYANSIQPNMQTSGGGDNTRRGFIKTAEAQGWLTAGRYYWDLSQVGWNMTEKGKLVSYVADPAGADKGDLNAGVTTDYDSALDVGPTYKSGTLKLIKNLELANGAGGSGDGSNLNGIGVGGGVASGAGVGVGGGTAYYAGKNAALAESKATEAAEAEAAGNAEAAETASAESADAKSAAGGLGAIAFAAAMIPIMVDMSHLIHTFSETGMSADPVVFLHNIGMACFNIAGDIWFLVGIIMSLAMLGAGACHAVFSATAGTKGMVSWAKGLFYAVATALFLVGAILGFYLPLYPYIIFTFGVLGWMISVIEAMVAAPLVCFGLTHPEGHDFLGPVQQSVMLFLSVFLRPVLLLIGLIAGMILSYVSLRMVIYTFTGITTDLFSRHPGHAGSVGSSVLAGAGHMVSSASLQALHSGSLGGAMLLSLVTFPLILAIFTIIVFTVTTTCYQLPNQFVSYIMTWIGGPQVQNMAQQAVQQIQSTFGGAPGKMTEAARAASQDFDKTMQAEVMKQMTSDKNAMRGNTTDSGDKK